MQNGYDTRNAIQELIDTLWNVNKNLDRLQEAYL